MAEDSVQGADSRGASERLIDWDDIREPGCYLHVTSGLVARIFPDDIANPSEDRHAGQFSGGPVICLSPNPNTPIDVLRQFAVGAASLEIFDSRVTGRFTEYQQVKQRVGTETICTMY